MLKDGDWCHDYPYISSNDQNSYETTFKYLLPAETSINELLANSGDTNYLDLMGSAWCLQRPEEVRRITGVRLVNLDAKQFESSSRLYEEYKNDQRQQPWAQHNKAKMDFLVRAFEHPDRKIIEGNVYTLNTWKDISSRGPFTHITCRPQGAYYVDEIIEGNKNPSTDLKLQFWREKYAPVVARAYNLTALGGEMYFQIPELVEPHIADTALEEFAQKTSQFEIKIADGNDRHQRIQRVMKITKHQEGQEINDLETIFEESSTYYSFSERIRHVTRDIKRRLYLEL